MKSSQFCDRQFSHILFSITSENPYITTCELYLFNLQSKSCNCGNYYGFIYQEFNLHYFYSVKSDAKCWADA